MTSTERVLARHPSDTVGGPMGRMGSGWPRGKRLVRLDERAAWFTTDDEPGRRWRSDLDSHVLVELDAEGGVVDPASHAGSAAAGEDAPATVAEAESWFLRRYEGVSAAPAGRPEEDPSAARWRGKLFLVTSTLAPFVAVAYAFGYERSMVLLAEHPRPSGIGSLRPSGMPRV